jgi:hypothetical protein
MEPRDVFIGYVEEDSAAVLALAGALRTLGYSTWAFEEDAIGGVSYLLQVHEAIAACRAFVLVASPHSLQSHQVMRELEQAHERRKQIIPVRLDVTHEQFIGASPIFGMVSGTTVTLKTSGDDPAELAGRIQRTLTYSQEPAREAVAAAPGPSSWPPEPRSTAAPAARPAPAAEVRHPRAALAAARETLLVSPLSATIGAVIQAAWGIEVLWFPLVVMPTWSLGVTVLLLLIAGTVACVVAVFVLAFVWSPSVRSRLAVGRVR